MAGLQMKDPIGSAVSLQQLREALTQLRSEVLRDQKTILAEWNVGTVESPFLPSARNLAAYIAFRRRDIRDIQPALSSWGLSSLGRSEPHILASLDAVILALRLMEGESVPTASRREAANVVARRTDLLAGHAERLFGPMPRGRWARIMVTMPTEAAEHYGMVRELLEKGMDCARLNCAHDSPDTWRAIIAHVRRAQVEVGRPCRILMDLAGPRIRSGPLATKPGILHIKPYRHPSGKIFKPGVLCLASASGHGRPASKDPKGTIVPAQASVENPEWLESLEQDDRVSCVDLRGKTRTFTVADRSPGGARLESARSVFLKGGSVLVRERAGKGPRKTALGPVEPSFVLFRLWTGDRLRLVKAQVSGHIPQRDQEGRLSKPAVLQCLPPEILDDVRPGERVWIDDGALGGEVLSADPEGVDVLVTHAHPNGTKVGSEKGMNFPDTAIRLPSLGDRDREDLKFAVENADIVGYSFVRTPDDMDALVNALFELGGKGMGIIAKIENQTAFTHLPEIIVRGAARHPFGVMIARGDLAVEIGYRRLAEVQEEILWLCEAAHVPVIWATQVLESLVKAGIPSRAEITDAAMSERADCVMLNKGPFLLDAVAVLDDVIARMEEHQNKKTPTLRALKSW